MSSIRSGYIVPLLLTGLFVICFFSFAGYLAVYNNSNADITSDPSINQYLTSLNSTLKNSSSTADNSSDALYGSSSSTSGGNIILEAVTGIWKSITSTPKQIYLLTIGLVQSKVLGGSTFYLVFGTIGAILSITLIMLVWRWLRGIN